MKSAFIKMFVQNGVYKHKQNDSNDVYVCMSLLTTSIGKLVLYQYKEDGVYIKTNIIYFLNSYMDDDLKSIFLNRENYDMLGLVGDRYELSQDNMELRRK